MGRRVLRSAYLSDFVYVLYAALSFFSYLYLHSVGIFRRDPVSEIIVIYHFRLRASKGVSEAGWGPVFGCLPT